MPISDSVTPSEWKQPGTYVLILEMEADQAVPIGRLGTFDLRRGWYAYVGSAFGSGGLRGRLKHHLTPPARPHWHIDYLRAAATVREVWYSASSTPYEHEWASALRSLPQTTIPIPRFGASDCRCAAHLFHFDQYPDLTTFHLATHPTKLSSCRIE